MKTCNYSFGKSNELQTLENEISEIIQVHNELKSGNYYSEYQESNTIYFDTETSNYNEIMNGLNKYKSRSNHELGLVRKEEVRSVSRYDSDTIMTRTGSENERNPVHGQPLNVNTKAFVEAANRKARMVTFFKNGEAFSRAIRVSIIPGKTFKAFHNLCDYLTNKSMIPRGVR